MEIYQKNRNVCDKIGNVTCDWWCKLSQLNSYGTATKIQSAYDLLKEDL